MKIGINGDEEKSERGFRFHLFAILITVLWLSAAVPLWAQEAGQMLAGFLCPQASVWWKTGLSSRLTTTSWN